MKKLLSMGLIALAGIGLAAGLTSCGEEVPSTYEIALITDIGDIDDKSFNQGAWEGVKAYAEANDITHQYYKPSEQSTTAYVEAIDLAIENGAKIIVTPGYLFEIPIYLSQAAHPDIHFVLLDGQPNDGDQTADDTYNPIYNTMGNSLPILYAEQQAGYLAGYAAVKDGYRSLGFMGGMAVPAVVRFGMGFAVGVNDAAAELGVQTTLKYHYTGGFSATPEVQTKATTWYQAGVEVIFACGGSLGQSVMAAAETENKKVIGVDVDQSKDSANVITSAMKGLGASVQLALDAFYTNAWPSNDEKPWILDASNDGVGLPTAATSWGFETFTVAQYNVIYGKLADGTVEVEVDIASGVNATGLAAFDLPLLNVTIIFEA